MALQMRSGPLWPPKRWPTWWPMDQGTVPGVPDLGRLQASGAASWQPYPICRWAVVLRCCDRKPHMKPVAITDTSPKPKGVHG